MSNTIEQRPGGRIIIHLGSGSGVVHTPSGVIAAEAKAVACEQFPLGSHNRKANIIAKLREISNQKAQA